MVYVDNNITFSTSRNIFKFILIISFSCIVRFFRTLIYVLWLTVSLGESFILKWTKNKKKKRYWRWRLYVFSIMSIECSLQDKMCFLNKFLKMINFLNFLCSFSCIMYPLHPQDLTCTCCYWHINWHNFCEHIHAFYQLGGLKVN